MNEKEKKPEKEAAEPAAKPVKKLNTGKILLYAIIAGAIVLNTVVAFVLIQATRPKDAAEHDSEAKADSLTSHEGEGGAVSEGEPIADPVEAIVNIAGTNGERFLKVVLLLCYEPSKYPKMIAGGEGGGGLGAKKAVFKDMLIEIISQMTIVELGEPESREKIRKDFLRRVNSTMASGTGAFSNVLIDQFIIQ
jgi:flagellar basal body-associated protein FliL